MNFGQMTADYLFKFPGNPQTYLKTGVHTFRDNDGVTAFAESSRPVDPIMPRQQFLELPPMGNRIKYREGSPREFETLRAITRSGWDGYDPKARCEIYDAGHYKSHTIFRGTGELIAQRTIVYDPFGKEQLDVHIYIDPKALYGPDHDPGRPTNWRITAAAEYREREAESIATGAARLSAATHRPIAGFASPALPHVV